MLQLFDYYFYKKKCLRKVQQNVIFMGLSINMINMITNRPSKIEQTFQEIVRDHSDRIYNLALMKSNQVTLAEDICQVTFMRVYKGLGSFRNESQLGTWIYRIALNVCHTMISKEARVSVNMVSLDDREDIELVEDKGDVEALFYQDVQKNQIRQAISHLPRLQSDAITLYYLKEYQYTEVADIMEIPLNTVKSHIRRAKQNLHKLLLEVYDET